MKRLIALVSVIIILVLAGYFLLTRKTSNPMVLGSSINNFYLEKTVKVEKHPSKIADIKDPNILADAAFLIDKKTKYPLFEKNSLKQVPIASITKVMTATVALDLYKLSDVVEVKKEDIEVEGSKVFLKAGEKITVENLLYCLLMNSGNDAALTLSDAKITRAEFIVLMNKKAEFLGLESTAFFDPAGLNDQGHSSARDVALLFANALSNKDFEKIVSTAEKDVTSVDGVEVHKLKNSDRLTTGEIPLDGVIGGKTGFTYDAGHTLVTAASKNNSTIIGVVLKTFSDTPSASAAEMKKLLDWGFTSYTFTP
jgi:D-alanyl-D-alanine carboxypeptidase